MQKFTNRRRTLRTALIVTAVGGLIATGVTAGWTDDTPPQLSLIAGTNAVTLPRYELEQGGVFVPLDLGTHLVAGKDPFEIRVTRQSYRDPIVGHQIVRENGATNTVKLPDELIKDFFGFADFVRLSMADSTGKIVYETSRTYCPNNVETGRTRPDAPDSNPYPTGCAANGHPFTLGSVWGIQAGWSSPLDRFGSVNLPVGAYKATVSINDKYREYFKIPADRASVTLDVTIENGETGRADRETGVGGPRSLRARRAHIARNPGRREAPGVLVPAGNARTSTAPRRGRPRRGPRRTTTGSAVPSGLGDRTGHRQRGERCAEGRDPRPVRRHGVERRPLAADRRRLPQARHAT